MTDADTSTDGGLRALLVAILKANRGGLRLVEAAAELIAEDARFNMWVLDRKPRSTTMELWNLAALHDACRTECAAAWEASVNPAHSDALIHQLLATTERLRTIRLTDTIDYEDPTMPDELRSL